MRPFLWVALGSGLGGGLRYGLDAVLHSLLGNAFPFSTLVVNISGCLLAGYLAGCWATEGGAPPDPYKWALWVPGFCGGYTTFSAYSWQVISLVEAGEGTLAGAYAAGSIAAGLIAIYAGLLIAMRARQTRR